ncbi:PAS domain-containing sensor histidine kinase [uncultured Sphingomonas sp.]|uniref:sensor histidine kinase n=1 Tax=uncultured Sphingomonas sp. TaxID=158754 RepID=UPI0035CA04F5
MGFDAWPVLRRAALPFLAGAVATTALTHQLYATATLSVLIAIWAAISIQQAIARRMPPVAPTLATAPSTDNSERRRLALYLDLSPAPVVALDARDRLRAVNRAARHLLDADDMVAAPPTNLVAAIAATPPGRSANLRIATDRGVHTFALLTTDLDAAHRRVRVAALVDIDADLKAAEAGTLRDLVRVLSHEITNTLTPIASLSATAAAMLAEPDADLAMVRGAIETVARRAEGLQRFGEAYRDLARLPPPSVAHVDIAALITDLARMFTTRWPGVRLRLAPIDMPQIAEADADQLAQAVWAVMCNAVEAAGSVTITVETRAADIAIIVADTGPGIVTGNEDAIFQPFFTTKSSGSGIGLALARQVFRGHGGDLVLAASRSGETRFEGHVRSWNALRATA